MSSNPKVRRFSVPAFPMLKMEVARELQALQSSSISSIQKKLKKTIAIWNADSYWASLCLKDQVSKKRKEVNTLSHTTLYSHLAATRVRALFVSGPWRKIPAILAPIETAADGKAKKKNAFGCSHPR